MSSFYHLDEHEQPYLEVSSASIDLEQSIWSALAIPEFDRSLRVGVLGCGWVAGLQLDTYRRCGVQVVALCDVDETKARRLRDEYFPEAVTYSDVDQFLGSPDFVVADIATHVDVRPALVERALRAGKHVLSQKPFVEDLAMGEHLAAVAVEVERVLAVNQNGRWAPHFGAMLALVNAGLIGDVSSADFLVAWPQDLVVADMPAFASMQDLILFDFGAHWFDIVGLLAPDRDLSVFASASSRPRQVITAPTQAQAIVTGEGFTASLVFRAAERHLETSQFRISGAKGVISHVGKHLGGREVIVSTQQGEARIAISNNWFRHGMKGSMLETLRAISSGKQPSNTADSALRGLALCFAATASAEIGTSQQVGSRRTRQDRSGL